MALTKENAIQTRPRQRGITLIETLISMLVLSVGIVGSMCVVTVAIGNNGRSRQQSNSTAMSQMVTERIAGQKAASSASVTITDCTGTTFTISTAAGGPSLTSSGDIDFTATVPSGYQMLYTDCGTSGRQVV
jgi:Tfp pilus assembly protein PilV